MHGMACVFYLSIACLETKHLTIYYVCKRIIINFPTNFTLKGYCYEQVGEYIQFRNIKNLSQRYFLI